MSKALILIALIACTYAVDPFADMKTMLNNDQCSTQGLETIKPKIQKQVEILKTDSNNMIAKAELIALIDEAKQVYDSCGMTKKVEPMFGDAVKAAGIAFLLASNCTKDVGMVLLILDSVIEDPSDITNDVIVSIFLYILGRQGVADCEQFIHFIL